MTVPFQDPLAPDRSTRSNTPVAWLGATNSPCLESGLV